MSIDIKKTIAMNAARLLKDGQVVNLGIGIPTMVANYIPENVGVIFQSENGILGLGPTPKPGEENPDFLDAGSNLVTIEPGGVFMNSADGFGLIRSGHVDATVLGALQVDEKGNLANWMIPGKMIAGYGGAMDLITCTPVVIAAMEHANKGKAKILKECTFPLTGVSCVTYIVTEMGFMEVTDRGIVLREVAEGLTPEDVQAATEAELIIPDDLKVMPVVQEN